MTNICSCKYCDLRDLFFTNIRSKDRETICSIKTELYFNKGDKIFQENQKIETFAYLKSGLVKLSRLSSSKKEQLLFIAKPLDFVSLLSVFSENNYKYSVTAIEDSVVCELDINIVKNLINENSDFALDIMKKMSKISDFIITQSLNIRERNLNGRIAYLLNYFSSQIYTSNTFELPITRKEIGEYIGMSTENIIRSMSSLKKEGIIDIRGKIIEITNPKKLQILSDLG